MLSIALAARKWGVKSLLVPVDNAREAAIVRDIEVRAVKNLLEAVKYLNGEINIEPIRLDMKEIFHDSSSYDLDFADVKGQQDVKRAIDVALSQWGGKIAA